MFDKIQFQHLHTCMHYDDVLFRFLNLWTKLRCIQYQFAKVSVFIEGLRYIYFNLYKFIYVTEVVLEFSDQFTCLDLYCTSYKLTSYNSSSPLKILVCILQSSTPGYILCCLSGLYMYYHLGIFFQSFKKEIRLCSYSH